MTRAAFSPFLAIAPAASAARDRVRTPPGGVVGGCGSAISGGGAGTV
ncbi:hypothetical protein GCM10009416_50130 [Craurococcus roseus]|uniref:Uncharacterized protein n=1 Tax=Craurococcus roseus TaxID=77585 RepID=A0ABN1GA10_9PROT